ncbi:MAG: fimbrillin family protein [Rikenellaceae bacterium]
MRKPITTFACALLLFACDNSDSLLNDSTSLAKDVTFGSSIDSTTRVQAGQFENGDEICVTAFDGESTYAERVSYSYNGTLFTSASPITYESETQQLSFIASYPAISDFGKTFSFSAQSDQNTSDNYEMSDLLIAQIDPTNADTPTLKFSHTMSNIVIDLGDTSLAGGVMSVHAKNTVAIDIDGDSYTATGDVEEITPSKTSDTTYEVIIAPQSIASGEVIASYLLNDVTYEWKSTMDREFESGKSYKYSWGIDVLEEETEEEIIDVDELIGDPFFNEDLAASTTAWNTTNTSYVSIVDDCGITNRGLKMAYNGSNQVAYAPSIEIVAGESYVVSYEAIYYPTVGTMTSATTGEFITLNMCQGTSYNGTNLTNLYSEGYDSYSQRVYRYDSDEVKIKKEFEITIPSDITYSAITPKLVITSGTAYIDNVSFKLKTDDEVTDETTEGEGETGDNNDDETTTVVDSYDNETGAYLSYNLVDNSGFEEGCDDWVVFTPWASHTADLFASQWGVITNYPIYGSTSLWISTYTQVLAAYYPIAAGKVTAGVSYTFGMTGRVHSASAGDGAGNTGADSGNNVHFRTYSATGTQITNYNVDGCNITTDVDTQLTITFEATEDMATDGFRLGIYKSGGIAYIDNVYLVPTASLTAE